MSQRLVLPSPNGSTISQQLGDSGSTVLAVSLRNYQAAAYKKTNAAYKQNRSSSHRCR